MLNIGDFAFDATTGTNVQVLEKIDAWGCVSYKVFNPATGKVYNTKADIGKKRSRPGVNPRASCTMYQATQPSLYSV